MYLWSLVSISSVAAENAPVESNKPMLPLAAAAVVVPPGSMFTTVGVPLEASNNPPSGSPVLPS